MFCGGKIYSLKSPAWVSNLYDEYMCTYGPEEEMFNNGLSYSYDDMSLEELVLIAKRNADAVNDISNRLIDNIYRHAISVSKMNPTVDFNFIYFSLIDALHIAIKNFDAQKGSFLHFYRKICANVSLRCCFKAGANYKKQVQKLGKRVEFDEKYMTCLCEPKSAQQEYREKATLVDLKDFISRLPDKKKRIFSLYVQNVPVGKIAKMEKQPYTTIYSIILQLIKKFNQR